MLQIELWLVYAEIIFDLIFKGVSCVNNSRVISLKSQSAPYFVKGCFHFSLRLLWPKLNKFSTVFKCLQPFSTVYFFFKFQRFLTMLTTFDRFKPFSTAFNCFQLLLTVFNRFASGLLSAHANRFSVSLMQDFFFKILFMLIMQNRLCQDNTINIAKTFFSAPLCLRSLLTVGANNQWGKPTASPPPYLPTCLWIIYFYQCPPNNSLSLPLVLKTGQLNTMQLYTLSSNQLCMVATINNLNSRHGVIFQFICFSAHRAVVSIVIPWAV